MNISIIGAGYVGLVTGVCLAETGHQVICVDVDEQKVDQINKKIPPIHEWRLKELLKKNVPARLKATTDIHQSVVDTDVTLIAVGTPFDGNHIDLSYVKEASKQIGAALKDKQTFHLVVIKSTVVPGTTDGVVLPILEKMSGKKAGIEFGVSMNPEFLTEGQAILDFMSPDRIVLGCTDQRSMNILEQLYASFEDTPKLRTNTRTAEMIKYASNAMLATQISFANEIGKLCSALGGVDIKDVMNGVHMSHYLCPTAENGTRVQAPISSFLEAGCGFGGSCLPKDVKALIAHGKKLKVTMPLLRAVIETNKNQPMQVITLLRKHFASLQSVRISVLGLSFKPDTDDIRESPAIPIIKELLKQGSILKVYDPAANHAAKKLFHDYRLTFCEILEEALRDVEAIVLVTRWEQFKEVPTLLRKLNSKALFVDGRRMVDKNTILKYEGIGL